MTMQSGITRISDIGGQVADIARTQGEMNALEEARKAHPDLTVEQLKETQTYRDEQAKFGTGSTIQRGIQAATAALQGLAGEILPVHWLGHRHRSWRIC